MFLAQEPPSDRSNQGLIRRGFPDQGPSLRLSKPAPAAAVRSRTVAVTSPKRVGGSQRPADLAPNPTTLQRKKSDLEVQHEALTAVDVIPESNGSTWESGSEAKHLQHARRDFRAEQVVAQASVAHILERVSQQDAHIASWFSEAQREEIERRTIDLLDNVNLYIQELSYAIYDMFLSRRCPVAFVEVPKKFQAFLSVQTIHSILFKLHGTVYNTEDYLCENLPKAEAGTNDILKYRNQLIRALHTGVLGSDWPFRRMENLGEYVVYLREGRDYVLPTFEDDLDEMDRRDPMWTPVSSHLEKEIKSGKTMVLLPQAATDTFVSGVTVADIIRQRRSVIGKATGRARAAQINSLSVNNRIGDNDDDDLNDPAARRSLEQRLAAERRRLALLDGFDSGADESELDESSDEEVRNLDNALVSTTISDATQFHPFDRTIKSYNASHVLVIPFLSEMGLEVLKSECGMDITRDAAPFLHPRNGIVSYFVREYVIRAIKREERNQKDEDRAREAFFQANRHNNNKTLQYDDNNNNGAGNGGDSNNTEITELEHEFKRLRKKRVDERRRERRRQRHMIHRHIENLSIAEAKKICQQQRAVTEAKRLRALQLKNREAQDTKLGLNDDGGGGEEEDNDGDLEAFRNLIASSQASLSTANSPTHHQSNTAMDPLPAPTPVNLTTTASASQPPSIQVGPQTNPLDIVCTRCHKCRVLCVCHKVFRSLSKRL